MSLRGGHRDPEACAHADPPGRAPAVPSNLRVVHVSQPTDGGVARCVLDFAREQVGRGWTVTVACPPEGDLGRWAIDAGARVAPWEAARSPGREVRNEVARLRQAIDAADPDIVHLHSSKAGLAGRLALRGRRATVFQPHAWSFEAVGGIVRTASRLWERWGARWTDVILCVSEAERRRGEEAGIRARWWVIYNGVDLSTFSAVTSSEQSAARMRLDLAGDPVVVCLGRLCRQKGQDFLLDSWPHVLERVPEARLILVGDGPCEPILRARSVPRVDLVGHRDDAAEWLAAADVVAAPSRWEGMSLTVIEAIARGKPIVATDVPGARETVDGDAGAVVPHDVQAFADAVADRLLDPSLRTREGRAGRTRAEQSHDLRRTTAAVAELYGVMLTGRSGAGEVPQRPAPAAEAEPKPCR